MSQISRRVLARFLAAKLVAEPSRQDYWLKVLAAYLIEERRLDEADLIANDLAHELLVQSGQLLARVQSARPLSSSVRSAIEATLKEQTGARRVALSETVDPSLLGGVIARTPDAQLDTSVRTKLKQLAAIE